MHSCLTSPEQQWFGVLSFYHSLFVCALCAQQGASQVERKKAIGLAYSIDDTPPWYLSIVLGFQVQSINTSSLTAINFPLVIA